MLLSLWRAHLAVKDGRFAEAETVVSELRGESLLAAYARVVFLFLLRRAQGRHAELDGPLQSVVNLASDSFSRLDRHRGYVAEVMRLVVLAESGRADEARERFASLADHSAAGTLDDPFQPAIVALLTEVCVYLGDRPRAGRLYQLLLPLADRNVAPPNTPGYFGAVSRYLGLLATLLGLRDEAVRHFETALTINERMTAAPALAATRLDYVRLLLLRGSHDDRSRAADFLAQARAAASELGLIRLSEKAVELGARSGSPLVPTGSDAASRFGLSKRELDVLRLLSERRSNPEIAEALFISRATVRTHVDNILGKLGVHSRTEAVDVARRAGLISRLADDIDKENLMFYSCP